MRIYRESSLPTSHYSEVRTLFLLLLISYLCVALTACETTQSETTSFITVNPDGTLRADSLRRSGLSTDKTLVVVPPSIIRQFPESIKLAQPIKALVIGISNYDAATITSPSHTIGASLMEGLLRSIVGRSTDVAGSSVAFLGDLRLDPLDPAWGAEEVTQYLKGIGQDRVYGYSKVFSHRKGELWPIIQGEKLTKSKVIDSIKKHALSLMRGKSHGVLYIATHGILGSDGKRYAMATDSRQDQFASMLGYDEVVAIYQDAFGSDVRSRVTIIFDTCLAFSSDESEVEAARLDLPLAVMVVSATAPGQSSYYWSQTAGLQLLNATRSFGPFSRTVSNKDLRYFRTMSVVPVALMRALKLAEISCSKDKTSLPANITDRELGALLSEAISQTAKASARGSAERQQDSEYLESSLHSTMDSFYEMSESEEQQRARRANYAVFLTGCSD